MSTEAEITRLSLELTQRRMDYHELAATNTYGLTAQQRFDQSAKFAVAEANMARAHYALQQAIDRFAAEPPKPVQEGLPLMGAE